MIKATLVVPLLNANEPEARVIQLHAKNATLVEKGTLLFTIETTKAATDISSPEQGFLRLLVNEGDSLAVGEHLAVITDLADEPIEHFISTRPQEPNGLQGLRITKPARQLAETMNVDLASLPIGRLVTEEIVRQLLPTPSLNLTLPETEMPYLVIFGGGGHAKSIIELVRLIRKYFIVGIVDDKLPVGSSVLGVQVLGPRQILPALFDKGVKLAANAVGGILDINIRCRIFDLLSKTGFSFPDLPHPRATIETSASIAPGVQVFANAYIGAEAKLEDNCMVNTNAVVSHDCVIQAYTHIAPGALLAGHVHVGEKSLVGMGVTTSIGCKIGSGVRIGNGAILLADVPDNMVIQAGRYWVGKA